MAVSLLETYNQLKQYVDENLTQSKDQLKDLFVEYKTKEVGNSIDDVNTVGSSIDNVKSVATNIDNVNSTGSNIDNVNINAQHIGNINTTAGNIDNINTVAPSIDNVNITAGSIDNVNTYAKTYYGAKTEDPTTRNDGSNLVAGDLYFNINSKKMKVVEDNGTWSNIEDRFEGMMDKASFEALAETRRHQYAGSGVITYGGKWLQGENMEGISTWSTNWHTNSLAWGDNNHTDKKGNYTPILNINGQRINLKYINNVTKYNIIKLPQSPLAFTITDSTSLPQVMKQGDFAILADFNRNIGINKIAGVEYTGNDTDGYTQSKEAILVALQDVDANIDIYANLDKFESRDSVSRQDLVFIENWEENISEKDIVYPYGNIQYRGGDVDGLTGIAEGSFDGADTYSLFGNWQNPGDLVGKGYVWSNLSDTDKVKLASNPDNNIYKDGDNWVQVRYRLRVIKGLGNNWERFYYSSSYGGLLKNTLAIQAIGKRVNGPDYYGSDYYTYQYVGPNAVSLYNVLHFIKGYGLYANRKLRYDVSNNGICLSIPIALVQRRNQGIYHPVYNPEGCAYVLIEDSDGNKFAKLWYEVDSGYIASLQDCFDLDKIAAKDSDNATVKASDDSAVYITGSIGSSMSGRPDGLYADEVNERDIEDLRMDAKKKVFKECLDENLNKAISGYLRGKESVINILKNRGKTELSLRGTSAHNVECVQSNKVFGKCSTRLFLKGLKDILDIPYKSYYMNEIKTIGFIQGDSEKWYDIVALEKNNSDYIAYINPMWGNISNDFVGINKDSTNYSKPLVKASGYSTYTYNNTLTQTDIIGDPRPLQDRIQYTVTDTDETISLSKNEYLLCNDSTNNGGTDGHIYRWLGSSISLIHSNSTDGDANAEDGHIDFSDDTYWVDLGDDLTIGSYPQEWIDKGFAGIPLIVGEEGESLLPVDTQTWKLSKKLTGGLKYLATKKDGSIIDVTTSIDSINNTISVTTDYSDLGYDSEQEMLDLVKVIVTYETKVNNMVMANNGEVLELKDEAITFGNNDTNNGNLLLQNLTNKVGIDNSATYLAGNSFKLNKFRIEPGNKELDSTLSEFTNEVMNLSESDTPAVKVILYLTQKNNSAYLQFVFKEMKYDNTSNTWGDDNKFQIVSNVSATTDLNGKIVLIGQKRIPLNFFIPED